MRHAIMIMAHTNWPHLYKLVEYFKVKCDIFIHIDAKCGIDSEIINNLYAFSQVKLVNTAYEVNWGGTSVLESELALLKYAFENSNCGYFHLLSGQDYPVKPLDYFLDYFKENKGKEFIHYVNIPNPNWENNTFARFQYFYPYDWAQDKPNPRLWVREQVNTQRLKGIKRPIPDDFTTLYGSSQWFSISRNAVNILLSYTASNSSFLNKLWMTFAPEETYVSTILLNKIERDKIVCSNCRFILWRYENGNRPANLKRNHFGMLLNRNILFARKFEFNCSEELRELIDKYLLKNTKVRLLKNGAWKYCGFNEYEIDSCFSEFIKKCVLTIR